VRVGIIGGTNGLGRWFAKLFSTHGFDVQVAGRKTAITNKQVAEESDVVMIAVPIRAMVGVISEVLPHLQKGALICDICSIKQQPMAEMLKAEKGVGVVGMHPLFGPRTQSLENQRIVVCSARPNKWWWRLKAFFEERGANLIEMDPKEHDEAMAFIQGATHFYNLLWALTQERVKDRWPYLTTPTHTAQSYVFGRISGQSKELIADLLINNEAFVRLIGEVEQHTTGLSQAVRKREKEGIERLFARLSKKWEKERDESYLLFSRLPAPVSSTDKQIKEVFYLGPEGTFSHQAARLWVRCMGLNTRLVPKSTIPDLFLTSGLAIVPAENRIEGYVNTTFDLLARTKAMVLTSFKIPIIHYLLSSATSLSAVKTVVSHPQAFAQCQEWIRKNCPQAEFEPSSSTVSAIKQYKQRGDVAFIAPKEAATRYNLNILARNIGDEKNNETEFYVVRSSLFPQPIKPEPQKTLFIFSIYDRKGGLRDILDVFAERDVNLTKIFSRPSRSQAWDYLFFIEAETRADADLEKNIVEACGPLCLFTKVAGHTNGARLEQ